MTTIIGNGVVITRDPTNPFIEQGAVAFTGPLITDVGPTATITSHYPKAEFIDAMGRIIMPGFINTHMHCYSTFARGIALPKQPQTTFGGVLANVWWKLDTLLTLDTVYHSAVAAFLDSIRNGVTSVIDHHASPHAIRGSLFRIADAAELVGIRCNCCYEISDRSGTQGTIDGIQENADFIRESHMRGDDMMGALMGMHAQMTLSSDTLRQVSKAGKELNTGFHIHVAEGYEDVADCVKNYNERPIERLNSYGILNDQSIAVHCVQITEQERTLLAQTGVAISNCPESNMSNAVGCSPILSLLDKGALVGVGTDGYGTDVTESLRCIHALCKHHMHDPSVAWNEPHHMLFRNNATIYNRTIQGSVGMLAPHNYADIILVDYHAPTLLTPSTVQSHMLFGIRGRDVTTVVVNGNIIMKDRCFVNIDEDCLLHEARQSALDVWRRI